SRVLDTDGNVTDHCFQIGDMAASVPRVPAPSLEVAQPPASPRSIQKTQTPSGQPDTVLTTRQLLSQLRARLRVVEREIKSRRTLEKERDQLRRLILAAETERDNLRRIRAAG